MTGDDEEPAPHVIDGLLATVMTLVVALVIVADLGSAGPGSPLAYLFAVGFGAVLLAGRRTPRIVLVLTVLGIFTYYIFDFPPIGIALPAVAALYRAAERNRTTWAIGVGLLLVVVSAYFRVTEGQPTAYLVSYELLTNVALVAASIALGVSVRARRENRRHQDRVHALIAAEQAVAAERRLEAERVRIAQDLHDTVGHTMSVIAVHSNVAAEAIGRDDDAARRAVAQIGAATSAQLRELRAIVKILRSPSTHAERMVVGVAGFAGLVAGARDAGISVALDADVADGAIDGTIGAAAYRIVQESLTNVIRHSGAAHASVTVGTREDWLDLVVVDDGPGVPGSAGDGAGQGLVGMRERATALGGQLIAGPARAGGFMVHAILPRRLPE